LGASDYYDHGNWNFICDVCGFKFKASEGRRRWDGVYVCRKDFELRHPQEKRRGIKDTQSVEWTRPESQDGFVDCVGPPPTQSQQTQIQSPTALDRYGASIDFNETGNKCVTTTAPYSRGGGAFGVGKVFVQTRNGVKLGTPAQLPYNETFVNTDHIGALAFISGDGTTIVSNAWGRGDGAIFIHKETMSGWDQVKTIVSADVDTDVGKFGFHMSISDDGNRILVSGPEMTATKQGKAFVLTTTDDWVTFTSETITPTIRTNDYKFGYNTFITGNGNSLFISEVESLGKGAVYFFEKRDGTWTQLQKIMASDATQTYLFGISGFYSISLDYVTKSSVASRGNYLAIGSPGHASMGIQRGRGYIFSRSGDIWTEIQTVFGGDIAPAGAADAWFGYSVAMSDSEIAFFEPRAENE